jgi:hypothetical protein
MSTIKNAYTALEHFLVILHRIMKNALYSYQDDISKFFTNPVTTSKLSLNTKKAFNSNSHILGHEFTVATNYNATQ